MAAEHIEHSEHIEPQPILLIVKVGIKSTEEGHL